MFQMMSNVNVKVGSVDPDYRRKVYLQEGEDVS